MNDLETEKKTLGLHFVLLAIGEILKADDFVTAQTLQNFITREEAFGGFRIPLADCRLALELMENSGFIKNNGFDMYEYEKHSEKYNDN
jgi:hypothetical protein